MRVKNKSVRVLGTHGVPAQYGGFETAAEHVSLFLARRGWEVYVYCQVQGRGPIAEDNWNGLRRVLIPVELPGWRGTAHFDLLANRHAARYSDICLTFGYNTAIFNVLQRLRRIPNVINMDGIEWSRSRWGLSRQAILYANERVACLLGNSLIADHPEIYNYLAGRARASKVETITYGAEAVTSAPEAIPISFGLQPGRYLTLICRPIPENSILELVRGFAATHRGYKLVILGDYSDADVYHRAVRSAASDEVLFVGSIYDKETVEALRFHSVVYLHGHTVGGTNPSLVEAMAAGNPVVAHDNPYNRWVAQDSAVYFAGESEISAHLDALLSSEALRAKMQKASRDRHAAEFTWEKVAGEYEELLLRYLPKVTQ